MEDPPPGPRVCPAPGQQFPFPWGELGRPGPLVPFPTPGCFFFTSTAFQELDLPTRHRHGLRWEGDVGETLGAVGDTEDGDLGSIGMVWGHQV